MERRRRSTPAFARPATGGVLLFADVGQEFGAGAIRELVASLALDPLAVTAGTPTAEPMADVGVCGPEALIRAGQAAGRSVVSASGSILAMAARVRRDLPAGLICDDLYTGLSVVRRDRVSASVLSGRVRRPCFPPRPAFTRRVRTLQD